MMKFEVQHALEEFDLSYLRSKDTTVDFSLRNDQPELLLRKSTTKKGLARFDYKPESERMR